MGDVEAMFMLYPNMLVGMSAEGIAVLVILLLIVVPIVAVILARKKNESEITETSTPGKLKTTAEKTHLSVPASASGKDKKGVSGKTASIPVTDCESMDAKYAAENNFWICAYCETLNKRLPGDCPEKKVEAAPAPTGEASRSMLRGDLLNRRNEAAHSGKSEAPVCVACGMRRK